MQKISPDRRLPLLAFLSHNPAAQCMKCDQQKRNISVNGKLNAMRGEDRLLKLQLFPQKVQNSSSLFSHHHFAQNYMLSVSYLRPETTWNRK